MKKRVLRSVFLFSVLLLIGGLNSGCRIKYESTVQYDNTVPFSKCITRTYSETAIKILSRAIQSEKLNFTFPVLNFLYPIECLRKTPDGYYAVYLHEDGRRVFVFMDDKLHLKGARVLYEIKSKEDFYNLSQDTTLDEVCAFDKNTRRQGYGVIATNHLVKEGLIVITYNGDWVIDTIDFYCEGHERVEVPYILGIDEE